MTSDSEPTSPNAEDERASQETPLAREPVFNLPAVVTVLVVVCVGVHLVRLWFLSAQQDFQFVLRFAFIPLRYSDDYFPVDIYFFTGPWTYAFLHGGLAHLAVNMIWLAAFGPPLANRLGAARFLAFWLVASLASVALYYALHPSDPAPLVGASGAISGLMGAAARFVFRIDRSTGKAAFAGPVRPVSIVFRSRAAVTFLGVWLAVNFLMAFGFGAPDDGGRIAWEAHIGGLVAGFALVRLFDRPIPDP